MLLQPALIGRVQLAKGAEEGNIAPQ